MFSFDVCGRNMSVVILSAKRAFKFVLTVLILIWVFVYECCEFLKEDVEDLLLGWELFWFL